MKSNGDRLRRLMRYRCIAITLLFLHGCEDNTPVVTPDAWKRADATERLRIAEALVSSSALIDKSEVEVVRQLGPSVGGRSEFDRYLFLNNAFFLIFYDWDGTVSMARPQYLPKDIPTAPFDTNIWKQGSHLERMKMSRSLDTPSREKGKLAGMKQVEVRDLLGPPTEQVVALSYALDNKLTQEGGQRLYIEISNGKVVRVQILKGS